MIPDRCCLLAEWASLINVVVQKIGFADRFDGLALEIYLSLLDEIVMKSEWIIDCTSELECVLAFYRQMLLYKEDDGFSYSIMALYSSACSSSVYYSTSGILSIVNKTHHIITHHIRCLYCIHLTMLQHVTCYVRVP